MSDRKPPFGITEDELDLPTKEAEEVCLSAQARMLPYPRSWEDDCMLFHGKVLLGTQAHYCPDHEGMPIDETCEEYADCYCHKPEPMSGLPLMVFAAVAAALAVWVAAVLWLCCPQVFQ